MFQIVITSESVEAKKPLGEGGREGVLKAHLIPSVTIKLCSFPAISNQRKCINAQSSKR